jgi:hypothetical protein
MADGAMTWSRAAISSPPFVRPTPPASAGSFQAVAGFRARRFLPDTGSTSQED